MDQKCRFAHGGKSSRGAIKEGNPAMSEIIFIVNESSEGGYEAKALDHSIFTDADTFEELRDMIRDAVACHFEEGQRPSLIRLHFVREEVFAA